MADVVFAKIGAVATVGGTEVPVTGFTVSYALNMLPHASIKCALGQVPDGERSNVASLLSKASYNDKVELKLDFESDGKYPLGEINKEPIFTGYLAGPRVDGVAQQTVGGMVDAVGELVDLAAGVKLSWVYDHTGIGAMYKPAWRSGGYTNGASGPPGLNAREVHLPRVSDDLWKEGMYKALDALAQEGTHLHDGRTAGGNDRARAALKLITTAPGAGLKVKNWKETDGMRRGLAEHMISLSSGANFWDTIINYCSLWSMAVVPRRKGAYIIPFIETASDGMVKLISKDAIWSVTALNRIYRANLRGVVYIGAAVSMYDGKAEGAMKGDSPEPSFLGVADGFEMGLTDLYGQFRTYQWPSQYAGESIRPPTFKMPGSNITPETPQSSSDKAMGAKTPEDWVVGAKEGDKTVQNLMNRVAEARLRRDLSMGFSVGVYGPLRLDICPGTQVYVELPGDTGGGMFMRGVVTEVTITADADQPYFGTSFVISNLRTPLQDAGPMGTKEHPVFEGLFMGDVL